MTLTPSWPGPDAVATTTDGRKNLAGLIETDSSGVARSGIFPAHGNTLITARSDMNIDIQTFQGCAVQFGGPILLANDGVAQLPSPLVSPGSGTNFYVAYAKQNESTSPGTDTGITRVFGTVVSTTDFATARASGTRMDGSGTGLPTGAIELGTVQMPTLKTATNNGGVIITPTHRFTAAEGGVVWVRNSTELAAWTPADGAQAWQMDIATVLTRSGGAWEGAWTAYTPALTASGTTPSMGASTLTGEYRKVGKTIEFQINFMLGAGATGGTGTWRFSLPAASAGGRTPIPAHVESALVGFYPGMGYIESGNSYVEQIAYSASAGVIVGAGSGLGVNSKIALRGSYKIA